MQLSVLKESDQNKMNLIISNFSKTETGILKFSQLTMLLLDRCVFSQRFTFKSYHDIFVKAQNVKNLKDIGK